MKRILLSLLILQIFLPVAFIAGCVSYTTEMNTLRKNDLRNEDIVELNEKIGKQYWIKRNDLIKFYSTPNLFSESFIINNTTSFIVEELEKSDIKYYKVKFIHTGKTAYLPPSVFNNSLLVYIFTEDPKIIEEKRRLEEEKKKLEEEKKKEEVRKLTGISEGKLLWFAYSVGSIGGQGFPIISPGSHLRVMYYGLEEIMLKSFDLVDARVRNPNMRSQVDVKLYLEKFDGKVDHLTFNIYEINKVFYTKEPFANLGKKWGYEKVNAIRDRRLLIGMNEEQVLLIKGAPYEINRSIGSWGTHEQWIYRGKHEQNERTVYLYFQNGKLTSWQE